MFKSIEYNKYLGYDKEKKLYMYEYTIEDTDFTETAAAGATGAGRAAAAAAVINTYSKRNLNVPRNLLLYLKYAEKHWGWEIPTLISWCKRYTPDFNKYEKDVERYLLLM